MLQSQLHPQLRRVKQVEQWPCYFHKKVVGHVECSHTAANRAQLEEQLSAEVFHPGQAEYQAQTATLRLQLGLLRQSLQVLGIAVLRAHHEESGSVARQVPVAWSLFDVVKALWVASRH